MPFLKKLKVLILNIFKYKWILKMIFYWSAYKKFIFTLKFIF